MSDYENKQLGSYRLIRFLGEGSFADVYLGEHVYLNRRAAIKVLRTRLAKDDMEGFLTEARTIAGLEHPHIVQVLDFGVENNIPFLVMSYAPNGTLRQRHPGGTPLPPTIILPYVQQIASALQYAHDRKLIHRDIKPHNLLLNPNNEIWISDFGLVLIAQSTMSQITQNPAGTPAYMAPEQFAGKPRPASDQYALGVVVYEWLCGERPFHGTYSELFSQHNFIPAPPLREKVPVISPAVEEVVLTALAKDPYKRFSTVMAFANALEQACKAEPYLLPSSNFDLPAPSARVEPPPSEKATPVLDSLYSAAPTVLPQGVSPMAAQESSAPVLEVSHPPAQDTPTPAHLSASAPGAPTLEAPHPAAAAKDTYAPGLFNPSTPAELYTEPGSRPQPLSPDFPTVADTPLPSQPQTRLKRDLSRRTVLVGLVGTAVALGGGAGALIWKYASNAHGSTTSTSSVKVPSQPTTSIPTPGPGSTIFTYTLHKGEVKAVAWSPDGQHIVSGSADTTAQVWDATTGLTRITYHGHSAEVKAIAWSPHAGKYIASGGNDMTAQVWEAATGNPITKYLGHTAGIRSIAWSPDGTLIASGAGQDSVHHDDTVQVWQAATGHPLLTYSRHTDQVISVAWSPDGTLIASASFDKTVRVWSFTNGQDVSFSPLSPSAGVRAVAWSPDGKYIASGGDDRTVHLWDAKTGQLMHIFSPRHTDAVQSVAWSPDGQYIASGSFDSTVKIWQVATGQNILTYKQHKNQVWSVAWSPLGKLLASGSVDKTVRVWQGPTSLS